MAVVTGSECVECSAGLANMDPLDRIITCDDESICRRCFNKRRIRQSMMETDLPYPSLLIGSLGKGRCARESVEALESEQSVLVMELFSEGL